MVSLLFVQYLRRRHSLEFGPFALIQALRAAVVEVWGLFVTDGTLAIFAIASLLFVAVFIDRFGAQRSASGWVLVAGVVLAIALALRGAIRSNAKAEATKAALDAAPVDDNDELSLTPSLRSNQ